MYKIEEIKKYYEDMSLAIKKITQGNLTEDADKIFNAVNEVELLTVPNIEDAKYGKVNKTFLIGRVSIENQDGLYDFEPTLTIQTRDPNGGLITEEEYCVLDVSEGNEWEKCFEIFLNELNKHPQ